MMNAIIPSVVMLNVLYAEWYYDECHYPECHYAKCCGAKYCLKFKTQFSESAFVVGAGVVQFFASAC